jgi:hypothetical protein
MNRTRTRKLLTIVSFILVLCLLPFSNLVAWDPPQNVVVLKDRAAAFFTRADGSDMEVGFYYIQGTNGIAYCVDSDAISPLSQSVHQTPAILHLNADPLRANVSFLSFRRAKPEDVRRK